MSDARLNWEESALKKKPQAKINISKGAATTAISVIIMSTLRSLVAEKKNVIAPLLTKPGFLFSNFWGDVDENNFLHYIN